MALLDTFSSLLLSQILQKYGPFYEFPSKRRYFSKATEISTMLCKQTEKKGKSPSIIFMNV